MSSPFATPLAFCIVGGIVGTFMGAWQCIKGHTYSVAAAQETTTVGRVVGVSNGKGGPSYRYVFSVNGVPMDDYSEVCATPLAPRACYNNGPVLVYYSYQPYSNSRLEDFAVASNKAYRDGKIALAIGLPLFALSSAGMAILARKDKGDDESGSEGGDSGPEDEKFERNSGDQPDDLHVVPDN